MRKTGPGRLADSPPADSHCFVSWEDLCRQLTSCYFCKLPYENYLIQQKRVSQVSAIETIRANDSDESQLCPDVARSGWEHPVSCPSTRVPRRSRCVSSGKTCHVGTHPQSRTKLFCQSRTSTHRPTDCTSALGRHRSAGWDAGRRHPGCLISAP